LQAMVATGKKLASIFYLMVERKVEYNEKVYRSSKGKTTEQSYISPKAS
jgi:hypothetical protein